MIEKNEMEYFEDAIFFAEILKKTKLSNKTLQIGNFSLKGIKGTRSTIQYNKQDVDLLEHRHEYTFPLLSGNLEVSLQLYQNVSYHYRLFCYVKFEETSGMVFSLNLTTEKESDNIIYLTQKIRFSERYDGNKELAQSHRRMKQMVYIDLIQRLGIEVTDNQDIILGIFDPKEKKFLNTNNVKFLNDFIVVFILKGHFQGNKGYQLEILPNYNQLDYIFESKQTSKTAIPEKVKTQKGKRTIPLGMRYKILKRDGFKCLACGRTVEDGIKLHIDHKNTFFARRYDRDFKFTDSL